MQKAQQVISLLGRVIPTKICPRCKLLQNTQRRNFRFSAGVFGVFEPDLKLEPDVPEYGKLVVQMKGYDFVTLESFASYAHNMAKHLTLNADSYPIPHRKSKVKIFLPNSTRVSEQFELTKFERVLTLKQVPSTKLPLFIDLMKMNIPQSVEITVKEYDSAEDEFRFVPDKEMVALKAKLGDIEKERENRKRR